MSPDRIVLSESIHLLLAQVMNEVHHTNHSHRFWKFVLVEYVGSIISKKPILEKEIIANNPDLFPTNGFQFQNSKQKIRQKIIYTIKHIKYFRNKSKIKSGLKSYNNSTIGFPNLEIVQSELGYSLPDFLPMFFGSGDREKRKKLNEIANRYDEIFLKNVILQISKIHIEHFQKLWESVPVFNASLKIFELILLTPKILSVNNIGTSTILNPFL